MLGVESLGADGITIRLTVKVEPGTQWALQRAVREELKRAKRLIAQLSDASAARVRSAEQDLMAMGQAALPALRKASAGEGPAAKRAAALVGRIEASLGD